MNIKKYEKVHIAGTSTTIVAAVACTLRYVNVNTTANAQVIIYDSATSAASSTSNIAGILKANVAEQTFIHNASMKNGITVVALGASDLTVEYENI